MFSAWQQTTRSSRPEQRQRQLQSRRVSSQSAQGLGTQSPQQGGSGQQTNAGQREPLVQRGCSEPFSSCFACGVAVVVRGLTLKVEGDVALLFAISRCGFDGIELLSIPEWNLYAECAIC